MSEAEISTDEQDTRSEAAAQLPGEALRELKPENDIALAAMRANLQQKLFGAAAAEEPVKLGRFVLLDRLGHGAMGVVYSAYDPELDRRVALKLLRVGRTRASEHARERLLREAQALARLSHPNVVPVYEVGVIEGQVFVVMEFVQGQTLRQWMRSQDRSWRDIVAAFCQAGQGLAAADAVDLVHRDFKPDNVLVGDDGRIRVLDFGLAREHSQIAPGTDAGRARTSPAPTAITSAASAPAAIARAQSGDHALSSPAPSGASPTSGETGDRPASVEHRNRGRQRLSRSTEALEAEVSSKRDLPALTATGEVLGTPAYMPPEQFRGAQVGPASDQFSFCVSLYEALFAQRPFVGNSRESLRKSIEAGEIRPPPKGRAVPRWLLPILWRGLSTEPNMRYPSMDGLLQALMRDTARRRRWLLLLGLMTTLLAVSIYNMTRPQPAEVSVCDGGKRELADTWTPERRSEIADAFRAIAHPYAAPAWSQLSQRLDTYADDWASMHESACRAHQRGAQSGALLDTRMACLARRKTALATAITVLGEIDAASLQHAVDVAHNLPPIGYCGNLEALAAQVRPPEDPAVAKRVARMRQRLARAVALENVGRYAEARALAAELDERAQALGYDPIAAEIALVAGRIALAMGDEKSAIDLLRRATALGLAAGVYETALEALARSIYADAIASHDADFDLQQVLRPMYIAEALIERVPEPTFVHALLLNNAGVVHLASGERQAARMTFERALAVKNRASGPPHIELLSVLSNLALETSAPNERAQLAARATEEATRALGPAHPHTLTLRYIEGTHTVHSIDSLQILDRACRDYGRFHPDLREQRANCLYHSGTLDAELGNLEAAAARLSEAATLFPQKDQPWRGTLAHAKSLLHQNILHDIPSVLATGRQSLDQAPKQWWNRQWLADYHLTHGMTMVAMGRYGAAVAVLERATDEFAHVVERSGNIAARRGLARAQLELALTLWQLSVAQQRRAQLGRAQEAAAQPERRVGRAVDLFTRAQSWYRSTSAAPHPLPRQHQVFADLEAAAQARPTPSSQRP